MNSSADSVLPGNPAPAAGRRLPEGVVPLPWGRLPGGGTDRPRCLESTQLGGDGMKRIGEILVDAKAITEKSRDQILASTKASGLIFGTAVLEAGLVPEPLFLRALSVQASSPPASAQDLASIPADVIALVPGQLAQKYSVLPFRKVGRRLYLAMTSPWDSRAAAEIEFRTGLAVLRHVAISARLVVALEKYYGLEAPPRQKALAAALDRLVEAARPALPEPRAVPADAVSRRRPAEGASRAALTGESVNPWDIPSEPDGTLGRDQTLFETVSTSRNSVGGGPRPAPAVHFRYSGARRTRPGAPPASRP